RVVQVLFRACELLPSLPAWRLRRQNPENLPGTFESCLSSPRIPRLLRWPPWPLHPLQKPARAPVSHYREEAGKSRAPSDRIVSDLRRGEKKPSPFDQTLSAEISSA